MTHDRAQMVLDESVSHNWCLGLLDTPSRTSYVSQ